MRKQRGVTMIGWIVLLIPVAIVIYAAIRVGPSYYEYYKLVSAMKSTANDLKSDETVTPQAIRSALQRRFDTSYVDSTNADQILVAKVDANWQMTAEYDEEVPLFGDMFLLLKFHEVVTVN
jgi:hypothetical protein